MLGLILKSALILIVSIILAKYLPKLIRLPESKDNSRTKTVIGFLRQTLSITIYFLGLLSILKLYQVDITPYLLSSSIVGFAIGFGAQSFFKDVISGIYLLTESEFKINRQIEIGAFAGRLKKVTIKSTYLEKKNGDLYIIPNGEIKTILVKKNS